MNDDDDDAPTKGYLVVCSYLIALLDLFSAILFAVLCGLIYKSNPHHWTVLMAMGFSIFWIFIILVLLAGIWRRSIMLIRCWLIFTFVGIVLDAFVLLFGFTLAMQMNTDGIKITVLPFLGLAVEMTFVFIVYLLYLEMIENSSDVRCDTIIPDYIANNSCEQKRRKKIVRIYKQRENKISRKPKNRTDKCPA